MLLFRLLALLLVLCSGILLAACTGPRALSSREAQSEGVAVELHRGPDGAWLLDYRFDHAAPAWFFIRSAKDWAGNPWRPQSWQVETPGVRIVRVGHYDVLTGDGRPLTTVRIRVTPFTDSIAADYTPVLAFSDGGMALYSEHHLAAPLAHADAAGKLPADLNGVKFELVPGVMTVRDPGGTLLLDGRLHRDAARVDLNGEGKYVYTGPARAVATPAFAGIIDPGLPGWARDELNGFTPHLFDLYTARLGKPKGARPTLLASWGGTGWKGVSLGGSVLDGMVVMNLKGAGMVDPTPAKIARMRWFIGHEAAHFWMGQTVRTSRRSEAWMTEGAADLMAVRALSLYDPAYDAPQQIQREIDDCIKVNGTKPLAGSGERGEHRATYACGAVLMMAAEGAARRQDGRADLFSWLRTLIDPQRQGGVVSADDWIAAFTAAGGVGADRVRVFLDQGVSDPATFIETLLNANGVRVQRDGARVLLGSE